MVRTVPTTRLALAAAVVAGLAVLAGCAADAPQETATPTDDAPAPTVTASTEPAEPEAAFTLPDACADLLPAARIADFSSRGLVLVGGPDGLYGDDYLADETPEQQAGGITCIWGDETDAASFVTVSVAPVAAGTRGAIVNSLVAQGLNEALTADGVTYGQLGDTTSAPAIINYVRDDSWISVITALGGQDRFDEAAELVDEATEMVYS